MSAVIPSLALLSLVGCADGGTVEERLADGEAFSMRPASSGSVVARQWQGESWRQARLDLVTTHGRVRLTALADDRLLFEIADLELADVDLAGVLPFPEGMDLTELSLRANATIDAGAIDWVNGNDGRFTVPVDMILDYVLVGDDMRGASSMIMAVDLGVRVSGMGDEPVHIALSASAPGAVGAWEDIEFTDLRLSSIGDSLGD